MADILVEFMKVINIPSAHFFGAVEGGMYSMSIAQLYPDRVKSLTLCS